MNTPVPTQSGARLPAMGAWLTAWGCGLGLLLLLAALLVSLRLEKALGDLVEARAVLVARQLADVAEGGLRFGVPLADQTEAPRKIAALRGNDPLVHHLVLLDEKGQKVGSIKPAAGNGPDPVLEPRTLQRLLAAKTRTASQQKVWLEGPFIQVLMPVRDASGSAAGAVWVVYSAEEPQSAFSHSLQRLAVWALALTLAAVFLLWSLGSVVMPRIHGTLNALGASPPLHGQGTPVRWPWLPLPQAFATLDRLETEWASHALAPTEVPTQTPPSGPSRPTHA